MQRRPLGKTGLTVSRLTLGGAQFGQQYGPVGPEQARAVVHAAIDAGVSLIDTSAFYGCGESERILGEVLSQGWREKVAICTKAGRLDRNHFDFSAVGMRRCVEQSLQRLRTNHVEILLAHDIEFADDFEQVFNETAEVLHQLKAEGKARFIGMSCLPLSLLATVIEKCNLDVVISYCHFNLQNRQLVTELLPLAEKYGVGVLNASPLGMGLLTNHGPQPWHPATDDVKAACRAAGEWCAGQGGTISDLGLRFCLAEPRIPSTITGAATLGELQSALAAVNELPDPAMLIGVEAILAPVRDRMWSNGNWSPGKSALPHGK